LFDDYEWISWTTLSECLTRVNVGPNVSVTPLAFLGFSFLDFHQLRDRASGLSMT
ncbi:hypothetical protein K443DRAFT_32638, partial [Laccaria amethystina LaAM-08-1]